MAQLDQTKNQGHLSVLRNSGHKRSLSMAIALISILAMSAASAHAGGYDTLGLLSGEVHHKSFKKGAGRVQRAVRPAAHQGGYVQIISAELVAGDDAQRQMAVAQGIQRKAAQQWGGPLRSSVDGLTAAAGETVKAEEEARALVAEAKAAAAEAEVVALEAEAALAKAEDATREARAAAVAAEEAALVAETAGEVSATSSRRVRDRPSAKSRG